MHSYIHTLQNYKYPLLWKHLYNNCDISIRLIFIVVVHLFVWLFFQKYSSHKHYLQTIDVE